MTYVAKGFCTAADIQNYLGQTLTGDQLLYAGDLIAFAETYIEQQTRRSWLAPLVTNEHYDLIEPRLFLKKSPVTSIQSIVVRSTQVGDTGTTLLQGTDYELLDSSRGEVRFVAGYGDTEPGFLSETWHDRYGIVPNIAIVSYTPTGPAVPADIWRAATMIAAHSLMLNLYPDRYGLDRVQADEKTAVVYTARALTVQVPQAAQQIIDGYVVPIIA